MEEPDAVRPAWLDPLLHKANSMAAVIDIIVSPFRSFSAASTLLATSVFTAYFCFMMLMRFATGRYPYPFLDKLGMPASLVVSAAVPAGAIGASAVLHAAGAYLREVASAGLLKVLS